MYLHTKGFCVISGILCDLFITVPIFAPLKSGSNSPPLNKLSINASSLAGIHEADSGASWLPND